MSFSSKNKSEKNFYKAAVIGGIVAMPFTGGLSFIVSICAGMAGRKYNSFLQTEKERMEEKIYNTIKNNYKKNKEFSRNNRNLEKSVNSVNGFLEDISLRELKNINNIQAYPRVNTILGIPISEEYVEVEVNKNAR